MDFDLNGLQQVRARAQAFWAEWKVQEPRLAALPAGELVEEGNGLLGQFFPDCSLELEGVSEGAGGLLVFTAHGMAEHFPAVQALAECAETERYAVRAFREAVPSSGDFAIRMNGVDLSADDVLVKCSVWGKTVALDFAFAKPFAEEIGDQIRHMAMILADHLLGEWNMAVKVGPLDFVEEADEDFVSLADLPQHLEAVWRELGRSGLYPEPEWAYISAEVEADEEGGQDALLLTRNESANSLVGRADMCWCVSVSCDIGGQDDLQIAYDLDDEFEALACARQEGIATVREVNLGCGVRTVYAATARPETLLAEAEALCRRYGELNARAECVYDPAWRHYCW